MALTTMMLLEFFPPPTYHSVDKVPLCLFGLESLGSWDFRSNQYVMHYYAKPNQAQTYVRPCGHFSSPGVFLVRVIISIVAIQKRATSLHREVKIFEGKGENAATGK